MDILPTLLSALLFPGLLTALVLGLLFRALGRGGGSSPAPNLAVALGSREGVCAAASVLLAGLGLAALPWPLRPGPAGDTWLWAWAGLELAYLIALAPALLAGAPRVVRASIREAQIGVFARAMLWGALAVALALHADWSAAALPAHLLALVAALGLLPAAILWGPFAAERSVTGEGGAAGLTPGARELLLLAEDVRAGALVAALAVSALPTGLGPGWLGLAVAAGGFLVVSLLLRRLTGRLPRLTLPAAIRLGLLAGAPLVAAAALALALAA
jgi:hypothetical protein